MELIRLGMVSGNDGQGMGKVPKVKADPFVDGLNEIMHERKLKAKDLAALSKDLNPQTIRKLLREHKGSIQFRQLIASALGFESFAQIYELGRGHEPANAAASDEAGKEGLGSMRDELKVLRERVAVLEFQMKQIWGLKDHPQKGQPSGKRERMINR